MATAVQPKSTAVAVSEAPSPIAVALLAGRSQLVDLLPEGVTLNRVIAAVRLEAIKTPQLLQCTEVSLVASCARILQWGLEIGVTAYLVPFNDRSRGLEATPIAGYKGLAELMVASRAVRAVQAKAVFENDFFRHELGLNPILQHMPESDPAKRGAIKGAYCILRLPGNNGDVFDYMSIEEIEEIRKKFSKQWGPDKHAICPPWYAKKTVIRRASDLMPKNPRLAQYFRVLNEDRALELAESVDATIIAAETPEGAVTGVVRSLGGATEDQVTRILDLVEHDAIDGKLSEKIKTVLVDGMTEERASAAIAHLEKLIAEKAPAAAAPKPKDGLPF